MKESPRSDAVLILLCILIGIFFLIGIEGVPFHPDESSLLYQSRDLEKLFTDPSLLVWVSEHTGEVDQTYRLLNPPIPKYLIGIGRILAGYDSQSVEVDWNWSATWDENADRGAIPERKLLLGSRLAITAVLLCTMVPLILIAKKISGTKLAIVVVLIFGIHSLALLHGRRAMSEGPLIFGSTLAILGIMEAKGRPGLAGLGTAIAASSKLSAVALIPVGILAILWRRGGEVSTTRKPYRQFLMFSAVTVFVTFILNPVLWSNPLAGIGGIWNSRVEFSARQRESIQAVSPEQILETPAQRVVAIIGMMFFRAPQTSEVANYIEKTRSFEQAYLDNPANTLISGSIGGGVAFVFTIFGIAISIFQLKQFSWEKKRLVALLLIGAGAQASALIIANAIPFQRYYIPLLPFVILLMGIGIINTPQAIKRAAQYLSGSEDNGILDHSRR